MQVSPDSCGRPPGAACRLPGRRVVDQVGKQFLVTGARQEVGQLTLEPFAQAPGKFFILAVFEAMQDERAEQHLAARVVGAFLLRQTGLERGALRIQFGQALFDRFARHSSNLLFRLFA
ncbi:conserved hypothetical protein [Hyphomicrobiales bacterium]|nr:conserved hypothetical protein [Hyphomicrobiales bacterium]